MSDATASELRSQLNRLNAEIATLGEHNKFLEQIGSELATELIEELSEVAGELRGDVAESTERLAAARDGWREAIEGFAETLTDFIPESLAERGDTIVNSLERTGEIVQSSFVVASERLCDEAMNDVTTFMKSAQSGISEQLKEYVRDGKEQISNLLGEIEQFELKNLDGVSDLQQSIEGLMEKVGDISDSIAELLRLMDVCMRATTAGTSVASNAISDVQSVLEDVV